MRHPTIPSPPRFGGLAPPYNLNLPLTNRPHVRVMQNRNSPLTPEVWLHDLFTSKAVQEGAVIRPKARDVERFAGMELFLSEIHIRIALMNRFSALGTAKIVRVA